MLAEPKTELAVKFLLDVTEQLNLTNVILGATRGEDTSFRWLSGYKEAGQGFWAADPKGAVSDRTQGGLYFFHT